MCNVLRQHKQNRQVGLCSTTGICLHTHHWKYAAVSIAKSAKHEITLERQTLLIFIAAVCDQIFV